MLAAMFRLLKVLLLLAGLAGLAFVVFFVQLGDKTLYQHLVGISRTEEARVLGGEIEKKAEAVAGEVKHKVPALLSGQPAPESAPDAAPLADIPREDRKALDALLRSKRTVDQHCGSKKELYGYVVERIATAQRAALEQAIAGEESYEGKMRLFLTLVVSGMRRHIQETSKADWMQQFARELGGRAPVVDQAAVANLGRIFRVQVGPYQSPDETRALCARLKGAGLGCSVVAQTQ